MRRHQEHSFKVIVDWLEDEEHFDDGANVEEEFFLLSSRVQFHHFLRKLSQSQRTAKQVLQEGKSPINEGLVLLCLEACIVVDILSHVRAGVQKLCCVLQEERGVRHCVLVVCIMELHLVSGQLFVNKCETVVGAV